MHIDRITKLNPPVGAATPPLDKGTTVFWNVKDAAYGMCGRVLGPSDFYVEASVCVQFKGYAYHCKLSSLETTDPKRFRKLRYGRKPLHSPGNPEIAQIELNKTTATDEKTFHAASNNSLGILSLTIVAGKDTLSQGGTQRHYCANVNECIPQETC